ncbi:MAG: hypothetical protein ACO3EY_03795 [Candidatus Nanopelagicales bacterium]
MTKVNKVKLEIDVRSAAAVRQVLFESQKGYTNNINTVPPRIFDIREVIADLDDAISQVMEKK